MLKYAYQFRDQLEHRLIEASYDPRNMFYSTGGYNDFVLNLADSDWKHLQMVSVDGCSIVGYLTCSMDRWTHVAYDFSAINFEAGNAG